MEVRAIAKYVRVQPRKVRIIADEIRGKSAVHSAGLLRYHRSKGAQALRKVLISAIANAVNNNNIAIETLKVETIMVDEGPRLKRMQARAMGRGNRIIKKTAHITVGVSDTQDTRVVKPHGTKPKPRPTLGAPKGRKAAAKAAVAEETTAPVIEIEDSAAPVETPEEATPVTASDAPEEAGSEAPITTPEVTTSEAAASEEPASEASEEQGAQ